MLPGLPDLVADLVVGSTCLGCARPGRLVCPGCRSTLDLEARPAWPSPVPAGLAPPWTAGEYAGLLRDLVVGHKERRLLALRVPLGALLAGAVAAAVGPPREPVALVPVPSRPATVRARGYDATYALTAQAVRVLRREGYDAAVVRLLVTRGPVADQSGLGAAERFANLAGSLHCRAAGLRRLRTWRPAVRTRWSATTCSPRARRPARRSGHSRPWGCGCPGSPRRPRRVAGGPGASRAWTLLWFTFHPKG